MNPSRTFYGAFASAGSIPGSIQHSVNALPAGGGGGGVVVQQQQQQQIQTQNQQTLQQPQQQQQTPSQQQQGFTQNPMQTMYSANSNPTSGYYYGSPTMGSTNYGPSSGGNYPMTPGMPSRMGQNMYGSMYPSYATPFVQESGMSRPMSNYGYPTPQMPQQSQQQQPTSQHIVQQSQQVPQQQQGYMTPQAPIKPSQPPSAQGYPIVQPQSQLFCPPQDQTMQQQPLNPCQKPPQQQPQTPLNKPLTAPLVQNTSPLIQPGTNHVPMNNISQNTPQQSTQSIIEKFFTPAEISRYTNYKRKLFTSSQEEQKAFIESLSEVDYKHFNDYLDFESGKKSTLLSGFFKQTQPAPLMPQSSNNFFSGSSSLQSATNSISSVDVFQSSSTKDLSAYTRDFYKRDPSPPPSMSLQQTSTYAKNQASSSPKRNRFSESSNQTVQSKNPFIPEQLSQPLSCEYPRQESAIVETLNSLRATYQSKVEELQRFHPQSMDNSYISFQNVQILQKNIHDIKMKMDDLEKQIEDGRKNSGMMNTTKPHQQQVNAGVKRKAVNEETAGIAGSQGGSTPNDAKRPNLHIINTQNAEEKKRPVFERLGPIPTENLEVQSNTQPTQEKMFKKANFEPVSIPNYNANSGQSVAKPNLSNTQSNQQQRQANTVNQGNRQTATPFSGQVKGQQQFQNETNQFAGQSIGRSNQTSQNINTGKPALIGESSTSVAKSTNQGFTKNTSTNQSNNSATNANLSPKKGFQQQQPKAGPPNQKGQNKDASNQQNKLGPQGNKPPNVPQNKGPQAAAVQQQNQQKKGPAPKQTNTPGQNNQSVKQNNPPQAKKASGILPTPQKGKGLLPAPAKQEINKSPMGQGLLATPNKPKSVANQKQSALLQTPKNQQNVNNTKNKNKPIVESIPKATKDTNVAIPEDSPKLSKNQRKKMRKAEEKKRLEAEKKIGPQNIETIKDLKKGDNDPDNNTDQLDFETIKMEIQSEVSVSPSRTESESIPPTPGIAPPRALTGSEDILVELQKTLVTSFKIPKKNSKLVAGNKLEEKPAKTPKKTEASSKKVSEIQSKISTKNTKEKPKESPKISSDSKKNVQDKNKISTEKKTEEVSKKNSVSSSSSKDSSKKTSESVKNKTQESSKKTSEPVKNKTQESSKKTSESVKNKTQESSKESSNKTYSKQPSRSLSVTSDNDRRMRSKSRDKPAVLTEEDIQQLLEFYEYCPLCNVIIESQEEFYAHFHCEMHTDRLRSPDLDMLRKAEEKQFERLIAKEDKLDSIELNDNGEVPIGSKGTEFIYPTNSFYCDLCAEFLFSKKHCDFHVKSRRHLALYKKFQSKNAKHGERFYNKKKNLFKDTHYYYRAKKNKEKGCDYIAELTRKFSPINRSIIEQIKKKKTANENVETIVERMLYELIDKIDNDSHSSTQPTSTMYDSCDDEAYNSVKNKNSKKDLIQKEQDSSSKTVTVPKNRDDEEEEYEIVNEVMDDIQNEHSVGTDEPKADAQQSKDNEIKDEVKQEDINFEDEEEYSVIDGNLVTDSQHEKERLENMDEDITMESASPKVKVETPVTTAAPVQTDDSLPADMQEKPDIGSIGDDVDIKEEEGEEEEGEEEEGGEEEEEIEDGQDGEEQEDDDDMDNSGSTNDEAMEVIDEADTDADSDDSYDSDDEEEFEVVDEAR